MDKPTFMYHEKCGAEIFDSDEIKILSKYGWKSSPAGFFCKPYSRKKSFKTKWQKDHNKHWNIKDYVADNDEEEDYKEKKLCKKKMVEPVKSKKKQRKLKKKAKKK